MAHTPGPWNVYYYRPTDGSVMVYFFGAKIATVFPKGKTGRQVQRDAEANARLIAAAPALLEALELAHETISKADKSSLGYVPGVCKPRRDQLLERIDLALAQVGE